MKCTFKHIHSVETKENTVGTRIDGFIVLQTTWLPWSIHKWIMEYEGLNATIYPNGIRVHSWAETTCCGGDTYDLSVGSRISESKAKRKIYNFMRTLSSQLSIWYTLQATQYFEDFEKYKHCSEHELEYSSKLGGRQ